MVTTSSISNILALSISFGLVTTNVPSSWLNRCFRTAPNWRDWVNLTTTVTYFLSIILNNTLARICD